MHLPQRSGIIYPKGADLVLAVISGHNTPAELEGYRRQDLPREMSVPPHSQLTAIFPERLPTKLPDEESKLASCVVAR